MNKYTPEELHEIRRIVKEDASAPMEGYRKAAEVFNTSADAIRSVLARADGRWGEKAVATYAQKQQKKVEISRARKLEEENDALQQALEAMTSLTAKPLAPVKRLERASGLREACAVALLSDVHCEERVVRGETPVNNEYNPSIAEKSIARWFGGVQWMLDYHRSTGAFQITDALLWLGGDLMTGHIHEETVETTHGQPPILTLIWLRDRLVAGLDTLLEDQKTNCLHVVCSYGNHGRDTKKPYRARGAAHSYEYLLYQWLAEHYKSNDRIRFLAPPSGHQYVQVYDYSLHFHHGDEIKYQGGVGGITIPINKKIASWDIAKRCDFHHFGHFHQLKNDERWTVNGSVIGYNAYAMSIGAAPEEPKQAFYLLDSKRGRTFQAPLWVRE